MSKHNIIIATIGHDPYDHDKAITTEVWNGSWTGMGMSANVRKEDALAHYHNQIKKQAIGWVSVTEFTSDGHKFVEEHLRLTAELRKRIEVNVAAKTAKKVVRKTISTAPNVWPSNINDMLDLAHPISEQSFEVQYNTETIGSN